MQLYTNTCWKIYSKENVFKIWVCFIKSIFRATYSDNTITGDNNKAMIVIKYSFITEIIKYTFLNAIFQGKYSTYAEVIIKKLVLAAAKFKTLVCVINHKAAANVIFISHISEKSCKIQNYYLLILTTRFSTYASFP